MFGQFTPLGYIIVPKLQDPAYQKTPEKDWSDYRKENKKLGRADFDSDLEEKYEMKKDEWLVREQKGEQGIISKERFKLGTWLGQQKQFQEAKNRKRQMILAQNLFPQFTTAETADIVEIGRMGMDYSEIEKMAAKRHGKEGEEPEEKPTEQAEKEPTEPMKKKPTKPMKTKKRPFKKKIKRPAQKLKKIPARKKIRRPAKLAKHKRVKNAKQKRRTAGRGRARRGKKRNRN